MKYIKYRIIRNVEINRDFFEVVFERGTSRFMAGDTVTFFHDENKHKAFIATGLQEPWVRMILDKERFGSMLPPGDVCLRLDTDIVNLLPSLVGAESPAFCITSGGIGPFLSYSSMCPAVKCKVCYIGEDLIHKEWIEDNHELVDRDCIQNCENLYIIGRGLEEIVTLPERRVDL